MSLVSFLAQPSAQDLFANGLPYPISIPAGPPSTAPVIMPPPTTPPYSTPLRFIREPGHIEYCSKLGLGVYDRGKIRLKEIQL